MRRSTSLFSSLAVAAGLLFATASIAVAAPAATPTVFGTFDHLPRITFPNENPPTALVVKVLHVGRGPVVHKKDLIVVNYVGQIWRGKVFDSSYTQPLFGTPIGVGRVISGWDTGLVGKTVGSRILLVIPPKDGYGASGQSSVGITGTDTLTFVVDIVASYSSAVHGDLNATMVTSSVGGVTVSGPMTTVPKIAIAKGAALPKTASIALLVRGHGPKIMPGLIVLQTIVMNWTGAVQASTWSLGTPDSEVVGQRLAPSLLDRLVGQPVGSRFLALIPKSGASGPYIVVLEVTAQPHGTATQPS